MRSAPARFQSAEFVRTSQTVRWKIQWRRMRFRREAPAGLPCRDRTNIRRKSNPISTELNPARLERRMKTLNFLSATALAAALGLGGSPSARAAAFTPGNLAVLRVGDGTASPL